ncbi:hypothetical protein PMAYCL1PPCAC_20929, partial [Pristionchus mayeri]
SKSHDAPQAQHKSARGSEGSWSRKAQRGSARQASGVETGVVQEREGSPGHRGAQAQARHHRRPHYVRRGRVHFLSSGGI